METLTFTTAGTDATLALGRSLAAALRAAGVDAFFLELEGDLGAGKTVFVRGLARGLGVPSSVPVVSPTFTIARSYELPEGPWAELHHLDAYRLSGADELEAAGYEEMCGIGRVTCVEWGSHVTEALPEDRLRLVLEPLAGDAGAALRGGDVPRRIRAQALGPRAARVLAAWATIGRDGGDA